MALIKKLTAMGEAIRAKLGGTDLIPLTDMPEKVGDVYSKGCEAGKTSEWNDLWDAIQHKGDRTNYASVFRYKSWNDNVFKPKYIAKPTDATYMFADSEITTLPENKVDMSDCTAANYCFAWTYKMNSLTVDFSNATTLYGTFNSCKAVSLDITLSEKLSNALNTFVNMTNLVKLKVRGILAANNVNFSASPLLSKESLIDESGLLTVLADKSSDTSEAWTVAIGEENLAKLTDAEKAVATQKGWTLL